ncbi:putative F-box domain-containing protein [Helianthus annuus]|uniref:F-box domain-containing protein n=1 Tax=Helianthus annuus TaxID=4232 RepID=A0A251U3Q4_HELAN|nr:F-box/kelch-repeat protein At3g23880 [Helianthus annuus]KAF5814513.1 putative F-box domain-containing protein [Helianthus annuus]KAJ0593110.1 putative F-box domain-containing protein [Helianthus annuus]KAJ0600902.1 putative F-box domain-containing protein [Helianthus annuus]KAJ0608120.1 putative F-box domain-containing protein [Helianthus annuus]KAJ0768188.1 putative F-box domain-containing protein [Helianthus annuus]
MFSPSMEEVLPENLILDVLSRLPVKTIIRFKCVYKKWRDLVSDPYFVRLHLSRSGEALLIHKPETSNWAGSLEWVEMKHEDDYHLHPVKSNNPCYGLLLFPGSVNGLICGYRPYSFVYILNPVLEEYMTLPILPFKNAIYSYGFGVSAAGEYKVILCNGSVSENKVYAIDHILVHTIGTKEWRVLGQTPNPPNLIKKGPGVFLNSHVYWLGDGQIYGFDLNRETFDLFPSPPGDNNAESKEMLGVLKGRLSRISWCSLGLDIWVMKETSWYKERTIRENISPILHSQPLCLIDGLKGTSILIVHDEATNELLAYCLNTSATLHLNYQAKSFKVMTYRPSFVKLHSFQRACSVYDKVRKQHYHFY